MDNNIYSVEYQNDALHSYMVLKLKRGDRLIDYQIKMLKDNPAQNFLALHKNQFDNEVFLYYDITSKITLEQFLARRKLNRHELLTIIKSLTRTLQTGSRYLLQGGTYILDIKYLYINPSSLETAIAYVPIEAAADVKEELRTFLIDFIVYKAVFLSPEEGSFVYRLLSLLKSDAFSLDQLDKLVYDIAIEQGSSGEDKEIMTKAKEASSIARYSTVEAGRDERSGKNPLLIFLLVQLLFAALAVLLTRYLARNYLATDIYSITGILLIFGAIDFLAVKKLGLLKHREGRFSTNEAKASLNASEGMVKKQLRQEKPQGQSRHKLYREPAGYEELSDMETSVLVDDIAVYPYLLSCAYNGEEKVILNKPSFVIGRLKSQVDYVSSNDTVGKVHAEIICKDGVYYVKDLNSRNGTYVNGERIVSNALHIINNNDRIAFANSEYKFMRGQGTGQPQDNELKVSNRGYNG